MGEHADDAIDQMIWGRAENWAAPKLRKSTFQSGVGRYKWRRAGGEVIDMHDMDDEYLANCIRICDEMGNTGKKEDLEAILKSRQSVYLDNTRQSPPQPEAETRIGQSTVWKVPSWVFEK